MRVSTLVALPLIVTVVTGAQYSDKQTTGKGRQTIVTVADRSIGEFLENVASQQVTPSGGAVAAVGGAMGAALCEMVCLHTVGPDGEGDASTELVDIREMLGGHRNRLLELADEDASAVDDVQVAFKTDDVSRRQTAMKRSTEVPLSMAETCLDVLESAVTVTEKGTSVAIPDAVTGALLAEGALRAAVSTVRANIGMIDEAELVAEMKQRSDELVVGADEAMAAVVANFDNRT